MRFANAISVALLHAIAAGVDRAQTPAPAPPPSPTNAMNKAELASQGFFGRWNDAFLQQMGTPAHTPPDPKAPPPDRRGFPPPFDSPPFPDGDWRIGGVASNRLLQRAFNESFLEGWRPCQAARITLD
jgi:hypothetical protein